MNNNILTDYAFYRCTSLTGVTIPDGITSIGDFAFAHCESLTSVTIPDSVTTIGNGAFYRCKSLTSVTIPDSVTTIGNGVFGSCKSLTSVTIPDSVTTVGNGAFAYCKSLTSITIPESVTTIGNSAFAYCESLTSVTIPESVTTIGNYAFAYCESLTSEKANYKAFNIMPNGDMSCKEYKFTPNQWSNTEKNIELYRKGYHFCTNLFEIFNYYCGELDKNIAIYECEVGDKVIQGDTSKCVTNRIKPVKRIYREDILKLLNV